MPRAFASLLVGVLTLCAEGALGGTTGLDWDGTAPGRRMLYWHDPPPMYDMTYCFKVFQRDQVQDDHRYYTTFFWGNDGEFVWGNGYGDSYYGAHPYPIPENAGDGKWEISTRANDYVVRDNGSSPYVVVDEWYSQAFVAKDQGGNNFYQRFYIDLPSVAPGDRITVTFNRAGHPVVPPTPAIMMGQAPDDGSGQSWGGYNRWEEQNAVVRGIQIYASALSEAQILQLSALETDAEVLSKVAELGITTLWYLNMNPTPTDVSDKSGFGHHPSWAGTNRPRLYQDGGGVEPSVPSPPTGLRIVPL